jgi:hypothetical protein
VSSTTIGRDKFKFSVFYLYVNNSIFTRDESMINLTINGLNQVFKAKAQKEICDQKRIIQCMLSQNADHISGENYKTPSAPGFL